MRYLSLFSGIEAASVAWQPLGWTCVAVAEIEPFPAAVLAHHYPDVPNLGDVTAITDEQIAALGPIDVVIGGSPCQDLSVAGKRAGLAGERSGLFHHQLRIFHAARHLCGARFIVWENVPGAFSTHGGRDFAVVVGAMAGCRVPVPSDGWGTEGVVLGEHGLVEWAVLDAQWFGVAQRRRRVFAVLDVGDWAGRPPILLESDRLRGDSAPSREAGEGSTAGVIKGAAIGRQPHNGPQYGDAIADGSCYTLTTNEVHAVAHSLRAEGFDASEDGTGRGTPLVPVGIDFQNVATTGDVCGTLMGEAQRKAGQAGHGVLAFDTTQITSEANRSNPQPGDPCHPLAACAHAPAVAFAHQAGGTQTTLGYNPEANTAPTLAKCQTPAVHSGMAVRRLTPEECESLQGFPRGYTLIPVRGKPAADGPRYKALGNSMAVPVMRWIGEAIMRAAA